MKRYLLIVLAVILLSCFLISCNPEAEGGKGDDTPAIVGTWTCSKEISPGVTYTWTLKLNEDGSYTMDEAQNGDPVQNFIGTYSTEGDKWKGTVTNLADFLNDYTSDHPCFIFREIVDETHRKLAFSNDCEDPDPDYYDEYGWDATKEIYFIEDSLDPEHYDYWYYKVGDTSYEYISTYIKKDESGNEVFKEEMVVLAKAEPVDPTPEVTKVFAKFYEYDFKNSTENLTASYTFEDDSLSLNWLGSERTFTKK